MVILTLLNPLGSVANAQWIEHPAAVQTVYQSAVPHTDRTGGRLDAYDADKSFFPIALYHALHGEHRGRRYDLADFRKAGFNTVHLWERQTLAELAPVARAADMQLIVHWPSDADVATFRDYPAVLAWYLDEEPTGAYWDKGMAEKFAAFVKRREAIRAVDPKRAVFALDVPWITPPATEWWVKWNTAGDVSAHDNYPVNQHRRSLSFDQGVPESVGLAVKSNDQRKPVWLCIQAFEQQDPRFPFSMPAPRQLRCMAYAGVAHGATGLMYFALDSWVTRNGGVVGMAPDPMADYGQDLIATADQLRASRELWSAAIQVNREIDELRPALLSPTAQTPYQVFLDPAWPPVTPEPIRTLLKTHPAGGHVLIVVNVDAAPQRVRIVLPGMTSATQMFEAAGAGRFRADGDAVEVLATPYDVRVVRVNP
jgi:hypothetical protein